jgi:hypothetical protein
MPTLSGQKFYHYNEIIPEETFKAETLFNIFVADQ